MSVNHVCPQCGRLLRELADVSSHDCSVSAPDDTLDPLIQQASVPNLASLFKKAKEAGVLGPVSVYGEGATAS